jgi:predicted ester cyclase
MAATPTTYHRTPLEVVSELFDDRLNRRDVDALTPILSPDIVDVFPHATLHGPDEVRAFFAETYAALPDFHIVAEHMAAEDETVLIKWRIDGTFDGGAWLGIEPTGTRVTVHGMDCMTVRDGVVVHNIVIFDRTSFAQQIGMLPRTGSNGDRALTKAFNAWTRVRRRRH